MKKYVYMIDYQDNSGADQIECDSVKDVIIQLGYLRDFDQLVVENVKRVKDNDRYCEFNISEASMKKVKKVLGYEPYFMKKNN